MNYQSVIKTFAFLMMVAGSAAIKADALVIEGEGLEQSCKFDHYNCQVALPAALKTLVDSFQGNQERYLSMTVARLDKEIDQLATIIPKLDKELNHPANSAVSTKILGEVKSLLSQEIVKHENENSTDRIPFTQKRISKHLQKLTELYQLASEYHNPSLPGTNGNTIEIYKHGLMNAYRNLVRAVDLDAQVLAYAITREERYESEVRGIFQRNIPEYKGCNPNGDFTDSVILSFNPYKQFKTLMFFAAHEVKGNRVPLTPNCTVKSFGKSSASYSPKKHQLNIELRKSYDLNDNWTRVSYIEAPSDYVINRTTPFPLLLEWNQEN